jgi:hypothetical protein
MGWHSSSSPPRLRAKIFGSKADSEELRGRVSKIEDAEHFVSRESADNALFALRQIRELKTYSFDIIEA